MSGGGGGGSAPTVAPTYVDPVNGMSFANNNDLNTEIQQRQQNENTVSVQKQQAADAATQAATDAANAQNASDEAAFQTRFGNARDTATKNIDDYFTQQGYDPNQYADAIGSLINTEGQSVADKAANPIASFDPNAGASLVAQLVSGQRNQATQKINAAFSPTYANSVISSSWLPDAEAPILSSQFDPLSAQLLNASKRGTLNDQGYQAALSALSSKQTAAQSTLDSLGNNILNTDRSGINDYITGAKNDAANLDLGAASSFDPSTYTKGASDLANQYKSSFAGDLSNAVGSTAFADLGSLLNAGGAVQGANDPTVTGGAGAAGSAGGSVSDSYLAQQALAGQKRGIGTSSSF